MADSIKHIVGILLVTAALIAGLTWFAESKKTAPELLLNDSGAFEELGGPLTPEEREITQVDLSNYMNPVAVFNTNKGVIEIELFADQMPITVGNFVSLAEDGYYDGTKFHRVIDGFMIQGGDPQSKDDSLMNAWGTGGPGYTIEDEFVSGEFLTNVRGTIAMANTGQPNSGGSQFFINTVDNIALDFDKEPFSSKHPVFGRVTNGLDVVDAISGVATSLGDRPADPVIIESLVIQSGQ